MGQDTMPPHNPYEVLGVSAQADEATIKRAYRRLVRRYHPDHAGDDPALLQRLLEVRAAYDALTDGVREPVDPAAQRAQDVNDRTLRPMNGPWRAAPGQGDAAELDWTLTWQDAWAGMTRTLIVQAGQICPACRGQSPACTRCGGAGQVVSTRIRRAVVLPPGATPGSQWCLIGAGHHGPHFERPGDLIVTVRWKSDRTWRWCDATSQLERDWWLTPQEANDGGVLPLRGPDGRVTQVRVPPQATRAVLTVPGLGWSSGIGAPRGALRVRIRVHRGARHPDRDDVRPGWWNRWRR